MEKSINIQEPGILPLPTLDNTLNNFLQKVKSVDNNEYHNVKKLCRKNKEHLECIHSKLEYSTKCNENWLEDLWIKSYLDGRKGLSTHVNPIFMFGLNIKDLSQNAIAANVVYWSLEFYKKIRTGTLDPEYSRSRLGDTPLCMNQYLNLFGSTRIPHYRTDESVSYANSQHIVVLRNGNFYSLKVLNDDYDILPKTEIYHNLEEICNIRKINTNDVSQLTTAERNVWASCRDRLDHHKKNSRVLNIIDRALFVLCLDSYYTNNLDDYAKTFLHPLNYNGFYNSRWYDKLQLIVCPNGSTAINLEHTLYDGHILINYMRYVCEKTNFKVTNSYDNINNYMSKDFKSSFKVLSWDISSHMKDNLQVVKKMIRHEARHIDIKVLNYIIFGSQFAKENKMSPDGLFQMAFQLTYYKMFNQFANTYESVQMRKYKGGRTNNWRVVTDESMNLCKLFFDKLSNKEGIKNALICATNAHCRGLVECLEGGGFDRHMLALNMLDKMSTTSSRLDKNKKVELFNHPVYKRLMEFNLSTSNSSGSGNDNSVKMFGFNPVTVNGFGVGYVINDNNVCICITSNMKRSCEFSSILQVCLDKIYDLFM